MFPGRSEASIWDTARVQHFSSACHAGVSSVNNASSQVDGIGQCLFSFGICTDLQWADIPDMVVHSGTTRYSYTLRSQCLLNIATSGYQHKSILLFRLINLSHNLVILAVQVL
jgi:hypothetical protein